MRPCNPTLLGIPSCPELAARTRCPEHEALYQALRNGDPARQARYGGSWAAESRAVREAEPWCHREPWMAGDCAGGLTADHGDHGERTPLCRRHHGQLEGARRRGGPVGSLPSSNPDDPRRARSRCVRVWDLEGDE